MKIFKPAPILAIAIGFTIMIGAYLYSQDFRPVIFAVAKNTVANVIANANVDESDFSLLFCGTGSPNRTADRGQPCTALLANGKLFLFDAGEGAIGKLIEYGAPVGSLEAVFLTHLHSDHISGLAEVLHNIWLFGLPKATSVIGPLGTNEVLTGFEQVYRQDLEERTHTMSTEVTDIQLMFSGGRDVLVEGESADIVYEGEDLTIRAFLVDHPTWPQAYGYRIEHKDKVIVISGDTRSSNGIRRQAKNADILIHEALNAELIEYIGEEMEAQGGPMSKKRMETITSVHTTTSELAKIAQEAGVPNLIITHLIPAIPPGWVAEKFFTSGMTDTYSGNLIVARDGQWIEVSEL